LEKVIRRRDYEVNYIENIVKLNLVKSKKLLLVLRSSSVNQENIKGNRKVKEAGT
jgi:hypothetical protein